MYTPIPISIVVDQHRFDANPDPDPTFQFDADPDLASGFPYVGKSEIFFWLLLRAMPVYIVLSFSLVS